VACRLRRLAACTAHHALLNDTVEGEMIGADTTLEPESSDPPERVAKVIRNAEGGCAPPERSTARLKTPRHHWP
jgi:hypothetical protein